MPSFGLKPNVCRNFFILFYFVLIFFPGRAFADISNTPTDEILTGPISCTNLLNNYNVGYQYLGQGLSGKLNKVDLKTRASFPTYYGKVAGLRIVESNSYLNNAYDIGQANVVWEEGPNRNSSYVGVSGYDGIITFDRPIFGPEYDFNPSKHYYLVPLWHTNDGGGICQAHYIYGSADPDSYPNGEYFSDSSVKDIYFVLYGLDLVPVPKPCCSNVIFIPGIKGSVLKVGSDTIWPPTILSNDVSRLTLNSDGTSIEDVRVNGVLNSFYGTDIYQGFSNFMDGLTTNNPNTGTSTIREWVPLAYDWRYLPEKIIQDGIQTPSGNIDVIQKIKDAAANSYTGKVSIITHSMGGLMGKAIIKELENSGDEDLVESFVMVGSPQLGTPQAIASMLHGDGEGIAAGLIVDRSDLRQVSLDTPSAYNLLPSVEYFNNVLDPVITFDETVNSTQSWRDYFGNSIDSYLEYLSFVTASGVSRAKPDTNDMLSPEILRSDLQAQAQNFHSTYDNYQIPDEIRTVEIVGWGLPTLKSVHYTEYHGTPYYTGKFTVEGDGTVVYPSATTGITQDRFFLNLDLYREPNNKKVQHRDIISSNKISSLISSILKNTSISQDQFVTKIKPNLLGISEELFVSTHSPVVLRAYDNLGNFTGVEPNQDLSQEILIIKEEIPGSSFIGLGEGQYIFLPKNGNYNFVFKGTGSGLATVEVGKFSGDIQTVTNTYTDINVNPNTTAYFNINNTSTTPANIEIDQNSDGEIDEIINPDVLTGQKTLEELIIQLKEFVQNSNIKQKIKDQILKKVQNIKNKIENKKEKNQKIIENLESKIGKKKEKGKIDAASANEILLILDLIEAQSDSLKLDQDLINQIKTKILSLDIKETQKQNLLKRLDILEKKTSIIKSITNLANKTNSQETRGKITEEDANRILDLLDEISPLI